jgi:D-proline reductase (dithiol) PrdB
MCHQSVGLVQSVIEKTGIPTVSITLLREVTERVQPPRALAVDRPLGYPLGEPSKVLLQKRIILAALNLLAQPVSEPLVSEFQESSSNRWHESRSEISVFGKLLSIHPSTDGRDSERH